MTALLFCHPQDQNLADLLASAAGMERGALAHRHFPDGETYLRLLTPVANAEIYLLCALNDPDAKTNFILFFAKTARELGATAVHLVAPYLGYMRQDARFQDGEAVTSVLYASLLSGAVDSLLTVDPHLHRHKSMSEIYTIPARALHADALLAEWVRGHVERPLLVGPDAESRQWVAALAARINAPFQCLEKTRLGDRSVRVSMPDPAGLQGRQPVLVDDMVSSARTMIEAVRQVRALTSAPVTCLCIHPLFAETAYADLKAAGAAVIASCNTVPHPSNAVDIAPLLAAAILAK